MGKSTAEDMRDYRLLPYTEAGKSMQEIGRDDFNLLNGTNSNCNEKEMCLAVQRLISTPPIVPSATIAAHRQLPSNVEFDSKFDGVVTNTIPSPLPLNGTKFDDASPIDLFPTHPTTWQQHPMNSHEHAHHRLAQNQSHYQNHSNQSHQHQHLHIHAQQTHHQHRLDFVPSKLLLQNSDDPLICRGANNVTTDDDHPLMGTVNTPPIHEAKPHTTSLSQSSSQKKRPQNGCSSLTKQQLKVKAGLMSAQNQAAQQGNTISQHISSNMTATSTTAPIATCATPAKSLALVLNNNKPRASKTTKKKGMQKLRFHHQALPPEYLSHYEATQGQLVQRAKETKPKSTESLQAIKSAFTAKLPPAKSSHENVRSWLQKIAEIQRSAQRQQQQQQQQNNPENQQQQVQQQHQQVHPKIITADPLQLEKIRRPTSSEVVTHNDININRIQMQNLPSSTAVSDQSAVVYQHSTPKVQQHTKSTSHLAIAHQLPLSSTSQLGTPACHNSVEHHSENGNPPPHLPTFKRIINYSDLPYMGEITLDNSKPRRGRKPKKADICHLIYKNYGTIFPGTPTDVLGAHQTIGLDSHNKPELRAGVELFTEKPLNLCLRDQNGDLYSISSEDDENGAASDKNSICNDSIVCTNNLDAERDLLLATNMKTSMQSLQNAESLPKLKHKSSKFDRATPSEEIATDSTDSLLHPVSVYYQKLLESGALTQQNVQPFGLPIETIRKDNQLSLKIPIPSGLLTGPKTEKFSPPPHTNNTVEYADSRSTPSSIKSELSHATSATSASNATNLVNGPHHLAPQKRKRSAIFIPPIPAENTANPATEVSICKFKFTGGPKPTLQEKKMLSVDSGGNYRYYSGTGDKSTRGYEFFPRESLHQTAGLLPGVNCTAIPQPAIERERAPKDIPPPSAGLSNELLQIPESPTRTLLLSAAAVSSAPQSPTQFSDCLSPISSSQHGQSARTVEYAKKAVTQNGENIWKKASTKETTQSAPKVTAPSQVNTHIQSSAAHRKRGLRRSSQRDKLEKTFKEKGFLIQTQQLESAEGATYCKFRQLKKFTRYLFRNWKGYLHDELHTHAPATTVANTATKQPMTEEDCTTSEQLTLGDMLERQSFLKDNEGSAIKKTSTSSEPLLPQAKVTDHLSTSEKQIATINNVA